jgi:hypothetical protein
MDPIFAAKLYNAPVPFEPGTEEYRTYRTQLDDTAIALEDRAIERYNANIEATREKGVSNEWIRRTREELNKQDPDKYTVD